MKDSLRFTVTREKTTVIWLDGGCLRYVGEGNEIEVARALKRLRIDLTEYKALPAIGDAKCFYYDMVKIG